MSGLDDAVLASSLAGLEVSVRRSFTASSRAGVLAVRRTSVPWRFSVDLLSSGLSVAEQLVARMHTSTGDGQRVLQIDLRLNLEDHAWIDLAGLLEASLEDRPEDPPSLRWRSLMGRTINGALASGPRWVELHTPRGARRWVQGRRVGSQEDPYAQQRIESLVREGGFSVRIAHAAEGMGALWDRWLGKNEPGVEVARAWSWALGRTIEAEVLGEGVRATRLDPADAAVLGDAGWWWRASGGGLFLVRDGVRLAEVGDAVERVCGAAIHGDLEAPGVGLDADGRQVRVDASFHAVVAWLLAPSTSEAPESLVDGTGTPRAVDTLRETDEVIYAWPHQVDAARTSGLETINPLTPPQLAWLREQTPATFVPAGLLLEADGLARVDLTALRQGSVGPVPMGHVGGEPVDAYVHRHPVARAGQVEVHGFGRVLLRSPAAGLVGITVIGRLSPDSATGEAERIAQAAIERAEACADRLTKAVLATVHGEDARMRVPWFAQRWDALSPSDLGLRYEPYGVGARLAWHDDPLLSTVVGHERDGTPRTVADALERLRDAGGIVVTEPGGRWLTLESAVPAWTPWRLASPGSDLLVRVVGEGGLWRMPMVPEVQLRPVPLREQGHVRLSSARVRELREDLQAHGRAAEWARLGLLGHLLWARSSSEDTFDLESLLLLFSYDPHATRPWRKVSLREVESRTFAGVVPANAGHRGLVQPVLAATPSVAHALVELELVPAGSSYDQPVRRARTVQRPRIARRRKVWLRTRVVDRLAVGALTLADGPPGVEVWQDGLRSHTHTLPRPYGAVSGRLWLQDSGVCEGAVVRILLDAASQLRAAAARALLLSAPGSARSRALLGFVESLPSTQAPAPAEHPVAPVLGSDRLAATVRFALGRASVVEVSRVSWSLLREDEGLERVRLGGLHPMVRAAREEGASASAIGATVFAILFELHREGRLRRDAFDEGIVRVLAALE